MCRVARRVPIRGVARSRRRRERELAARAECETGQEQQEIARSEALERFWSLEIRFTSSIREAKAMLCRSSDVTMAVERLITCVQIKPPRIINNEKMTRSMIEVGA